MVWLELGCTVLWCLGLWLSIYAFVQGRHKPAGETERQIVLRLGRACWGRPEDAAPPIRSYSRWTA